MQLYGSAESNTFTASINSLQEAPSIGPSLKPPIDALLVGNTSTTLSGIAEQDMFTANVMVLGSQTGMPQLRVLSIQTFGKPE